MHGYLEAMRATFDFRGRASRGTFWSYVLVAIVIALLASVADAALHTGQILSGIVNLVHAVPGLSVQVRRLHDRGRSGWWLLLTLTVVGIVPVVIWLCRRGDPGPNRFGGGGTSISGPVVGESLPHEPGVSTAPEPLTASNSAGPAMLPTKERSAAAKVGRGVLVVIGISVGVLGIARVNGFRFSSAPSCSAAEVTALVQQLVREDLEKGSLGALLETGKTWVDLSAIRTRSTSGSSSECAAHVKMTLAFKPAFMAASPEDALRMKSSSELNAEYGTELTDDRGQVFVTMQRVE